MAEPSEDTRGFVLCGGGSRRMGRDKASLPVDGVPMARRVADAVVAAGVREVRAVGGGEARARALGLRYLADRWPGEGPLGGIITSLDAAGDAAAVVLACDLVAPSPDAVRHLLEVRRRTDADVAVPVVAGRRQWHHAAWHGRVRTILADVFASGERSVVGAALGLRVVAIDDLPATVLADADTPEELRRTAGGLRSESVEVPAIDIPTLRRRLDEGAPVFDVRRHDEYEQAHVPGVRLVPLDEVPDSVGEFPEDRTVYVICRSGARSGRAVEFLRARGIDAVNVSGGTLAWIEAGHAVETGG